MSSLWYYYWAEYTLPYFPYPISSINVKSSKQNTFGSSDFECLKHLNFFEKLMEFWFFFYVVWQLLRRAFPSIEQYISLEVVNSFRVLSPSCNDILFSSFSKREVELLRLKLIFIVERFYLLSISRESLKLLERMLEDFSYELPSSYEFSILLFTLSLSWSDS